MTNLIRLIVGVGFLAVIGVTFIGGVAPIAAIPFAAADVDAKNHERYVVPAEEATFRDVCPAYRDASLWDRWTDGHFRSLSWCGNYIERL